MFIYKCVCNCIENLTIFLYTKLWAWKTDLVWFEPEQKFTIYLSRFPYILTKNSSERNISEVLNPFHSLIIRSIRNGVQFNVYWLSARNLNYMLNLSPNSMFQNYIEHDLEPKTNIWNSNPTYEFLWTRIENFKFPEPELGKNISNHLKISNRSSEYAYKNFWNA